MYVLGFMEVSKSLWKEKCKKLLRKTKIVNVKCLNCKKCNRISLDERVSPVLTDSWSNNIWYQRRKLSNNEIEITKTKQTKKIMFASQFQRKWIRMQNRVFFFPVESDYFTHTIIKQKD